MVFRVKPVSRAMARMDSPCVRRWWIWTHSSMFNKVPPHLGKGGKAGGGSILGDSTWVNFQRRATKGEAPSSAHTQFGRYLAEWGIRHVVSRVNHPETNGKLERFWREYDRHRWRYATLEEFLEWHNDQVPESLWVEMHETPREAWQRKMPGEVQLGQFFRRIEEGRIEA